MRLFRHFNHSLNIFAEFRSLELERLFRLEYFARDFYQISGVMFVFLLPSLFFSYSDYLLMDLSPMFWSCLAIRLLYVAMTLLIIYAMCYCKKYRNFTCFDKLSILYLVLLIIFFVLLNRNRPSGYIANVFLDSTLIIAFYTAFPMSLKKQIPMALVFTLADYYLVSSTRGELNPIVLHAIRGAFLFANIFGTYISWTIHRTKRMAFQMYLNSEKISSELKDTISSRNILMSILAHDLRAPFQVLVNYSQILCEDKLSFDKQKEVSSYIYRLSRESFDLLENLLAWCHVDHHQLNFRPKTIPVLEIINPIQFLFDQIALSKNITITYTVSSNCEVLCDHNMISTVIRNLLHNAIKFSPTHSEIKLIVNCSDDEREVIFSVSDQGEGMSVEQISSLMDREALISHEGTMGEVGHGLGLFLSSALIHLHKGKIWASRGDSGGLTIRFSLPR